MTRSRGAESSLILERILPRLRHLDLGVHISSAKPVLAYRGGFGDVYTGEMCLKGSQGKVKVAMKQSRASLHEEEFANAFAKELVIWAKLDHKNIIRLEGFIQENGFPTLISRWESNGSLRGYILNNKEYDVMQMVTGIADGLSYLHSLGVIHSDLKSDNVLLGNQEQPMICDFGISRMLSYSVTVLASTSYEKLRGSIRWTSYELLMEGEETVDLRTSIEMDAISLSSGNHGRGGTFIHTKASDVWAFGMVVLEIISRNLPFANIRSDPGVIVSIIKRRLPDKPQTVNIVEDGLWELCLQCWDHSPNKRIAIDEAQTVLTQILKTRFKPKHRGVYTRHIRPARPYASGRVLQAWEELSFPTMARRTRGYDLSAEPSNAICTPGTVEGTNAEAMHISHILNPIAFSQATIQDIQAIKIVIDGWHTNILADLKFRRFESRSWKRNVVEAARYEVSFGKEILLKIEELQKCVEAQTVSTTCIENVGAFEESCHVFPIGQLPVGRNPSLEPFDESLLEKTRWILANVRKMRKNLHAFAGMMIDLRRYTNEQAMHSKVVHMFSPTQAQLQMLYDTNDRGPTPIIFFLTPFIIVGNTSETNVKTASTLLKTNIPDALKRINSNLKALCTFFFIEVWNQ